MESVKTTKKVLNLIWISGGRHYTYEAKNKRLKRCGFPEIHLCIQCNLIKKLTVFGFDILLSKSLWNRMGWGGRWEVFGNDCVCVWGVMELGSVAHWQNKCLACVRPSMRKKKKRRKCVIYALETLKKNKCRDSQTITDTCFFKIY